MGRWQQAVHDRVVGVPPRRSPGLPPPPPGRPVVGALRVAAIVMALLAVGRGAIGAVDGSWLLVAGQAASGAGWLLLAWQVRPVWRTRPGVPDRWGVHVPGAVLVLAALLVVGGLVLSALG